MPEMAEITEEWVEGFAKEAQSMGLTEEETIELLKTAQHYMMMQDPNYAAGFNEEFEKSAQGVAGLLGRAFMKLLPGAAVAVPATLGTSALADYVGRHWGVGPQERMYQQIGADLQRGSLDPYSAQQQMRNLMTGQAQRAAGSLGGTYQSQAERIKELEGKLKNQGGYYGNAYMF